MTRKWRGAQLAVMLAVPILISAPVQAQQQPRKPNIVIIWGDDVGQSNISAYSRGLMGYQTPNIDRVASEGTMFTDYYAEQSCTAGRASFITGQSGLRTGMTKVGLPGATLGLQKEDPTTAELLKVQGYATGQFGKNHLGDRNEFLPTVHGFDEFYGNLYHLNAEEEPELPDYPKDPAFRDLGDRTPGNRPDAGNRPSAGARPGTKSPAGGGAPRRDSAMGNIPSGKVANAQAARGRDSLGGGAAARGGGGAGRVAAGGGGGPRVGGGGGGGGARMGGGGGGRGGGGGGGGRRSDINSKHDIALIGRLDNGLGFYRYRYNGSNKAYVGVMAQEVQAVMPDAVVRGPDGYLRVFYDRLGLTFESYDHWVASGARIPSATAIRHTQPQNW